jgi:hypothetical protein
MRVHSAPGNDPQIGVVVHQHVLGRVVAGRAVVAIVLLGQVQDGFGERQSGGGEAHERRRGPCGEVGEVQVREIEERFEGVEKR